MTSLLDAGASRPQYHLALALFTTGPGSILPGAILSACLPLGLHQPIVHALFALTPFLFDWSCNGNGGRSHLRRRLSRRLRSVALLVRLVFDRRSVPPSPLSTFRSLNPRMAIIQPMNLLLIIGWSSSRDAAAGDARREPLVLDSPPDHSRRDGQLSADLRFLFFLLSRSGSRMGLPLFPWGPCLFHPRRRRRLQSIVEPCWGKAARKDSSLPVSRHRC